MTPVVTPEAAALLADIFEDRWPAGRNCFDANVALRLPPWWPSLLVVWQHPDGRPPDHFPGTAYAAAWPEAAALLRRLHDEFTQENAE
jgi:hypothetical protein